MAGSGNSNIIYIYFPYKFTLMEDVSIFSQWTCYNNSKVQSVSGSDADDLKNNTPIRSFEFSDSTEIGGILIPFPPNKVTLTEDSQLQSVSGSDAADPKNNLTQTRSFEFSDSTEIGGILILFSATKSLLWRMFLFSPSESATTIHNSSQYLALMQLISKIISHKPGHLSFPIPLK